MTQQSPENFTALLKSITARLGIETQTVTDAFGRTDVRLDRRAMEQLRDAARTHDLPELADGIERMLAAGGRRDYP